jgi:hypothetical protein
MEHNARIRIEHHDLGTQRSKPGITTMVTTSSHTALNKVGSSSMKELKDYISRRLSTSYNGAEEENKPLAFCGKGQDFQGHQPAIRLLPHPIPTARLHRRDKCYANLCGLNRVYARR